MVIVNSIREIAALPHQCTVYPPQVPAYRPRTIHKHPRLKFAVVPEILLGNMSTLFALPIVVIGSDVDSDEGTAPVDGFCGIFSPRILDVDSFPMSTPTKATNEAAPLHEATVKE